MGQLASSEVGPTSAFYSCVPTGMRGPARIFWANQPETFLAGQAPADALEVIRPTKSSQTDRARQLEQEQLLERKTLQVEVAEAGKAAEAMVRAQEMAERTWKARQKTVKKMNKTKAAAALDARGEDVDDKPDTKAAGTLRARSHCRFAVMLIHFITGSLI